MYTAWVERRDPGAAVGKPKGETMLVRVKVVRPADPEDLSTNLFKLEAVRGGLHLLQMAVNMQEPNYCIARRCMV